VCVCVCVLTQAVDEPQFAFAYANLAKNMINVSILGVNLFLTIVS